MNRFILVAYLVSALPAYVGAGSFPVNFKITVTDKVATDRDVVKRGGVHPSGQGVVATPKITSEHKTRTFEIKIQSLTTAAVDTCQVRYSIFAKGQHDSQLMLAGKGQREVSFKPMQSLTVETDPVSFRGAEFKDVTGQVRGQRESYGTEYAGLVVELVHAGSVVATYYDPPSLQQTKLPVAEDPPGAIRSGPGFLQRK
jgi:hypothetical protein